MTTDDTRDIPILEPPGLVDQARAQGWLAGVFNFGRAKHDKVDFFNSGFVNRTDGAFLITRRSVAMENVAVGFNDLVAFSLNGNRAPCQGIKIKVHGALAQEHFEDPRAVMHDGKLYLSCCNFVIQKQRDKWSGAHQTLLEVDVNWVAARRHDIPYGQNGDRMGGNTGHEKNWLWFFHEGLPHLVYLAQPKTVVAFNAAFEKTMEYTTAAAVNWNYGEIRGGTPPISLGDEYWTFFHSSVPWTKAKRRYFMGAYAFESKPPFRITAITQKPLLIGSWRDRWRAGCPLVVFPCGSELRDGKWLVTGGQNDLDSFWVEIPHDDLVKRMESTGTVMRKLFQAVC